MFLFVSTSEEDRGGSKSWIRKWNRVTIPGLLLLLGTVMYQGLQQDTVYTGRVEQVTKTSQDRSVKTQLKLATQDNSASTVVGLCGDVRYRLPQPGAVVELRGRGQQGCVRLETVAVLQPAMR